MAKKIPVPKARTKMSWLDKLFMGIGGASPFVDRIGNRGNTQSWGRQSWRARNAANLAKYGKLGLRAGSWSGLLNPWTAAPIGLMSLAQYGVGKAFDPYRDETGKIGAAGHAELARAARAREALMAQRNEARGDFFSMGGIARLL
jgi:hypothetical protein